MSLLKNSILSLVVLGTLGLTSLSHAANPTLPSSVQPGRIEQDLAPAPTLPVTPQIPITIPSAEAQSLPADAAKIRFVLREVKLSGNTVYSAETLQAYWVEMLNKEKSLTDIFALAQTLTKKYRDDGYILTQVVVPAQDIQQGIVRLDVVEGFIDKIEIRDDKGNPLNQLLPYMDKIKSEKPLTIATLERYILLLNDLSGHVARAYLRVSSTPSATDLIITVEKNPVSGNLNMHNRFSKLLGRTQLDAAVNFNDAFGLLERNTLRLVTTDQRRMDLFSYSGEYPVGANGYKLLPSFSHSSSAPGNTGLLNLHTNSDSASLMLSYPLERSRNTNISLRGGLSFFNSETESLGLITDRYRTRTLKLGASFDNVDETRGINMGDAEVTHGLTGMGALDDLAANGDNREFTKLNIYLARLQYLSSQWSLLMAVQGQFSDNIMLSSERFGLGGDQFLRAYDGSELLGDKGIAGKLELRYNFNINNTSETIYLYGESGQVVQHGLTGSVTDDASSIGLGIRFTMLSSLKGYVEVAQPLGRDVSIEGNRNPRFFAGLSYAY